MLKPNSTIVIIAPAGIPDIERGEKGMAMLRDHGYRTQEGKHLRACPSMSGGWR
jgi:muramoyltetrapeptide carboxypeptidase LdcA involved in peptidoglycan recycling